MNLFEMIAQLGAVIILTMALLVGLRVLYASVKNGPEGLRRTMDEGAGFKAFLGGRLTNGQGTTHLHEGHGLHFAYDENGDITFERKSKVV